MSEYPEKSKYSWKAKATAPTQARAESGCAPLANASNTGSAMAAQPSAITIFLNRPIANTVSPMLKLSWSKRATSGRANCGMISR